MILDGGKRSFPGIISKVFADPIMCLRNWGKLHNTP
jgi:hypothetical protein